MERNPHIKKLGESLKDLPHEQQNAANSTSDGETGKVEVK